MRRNPLRTLLSTLGGSIVLATYVACSSAAEVKAIVWQLDSVSRVGGYVPTVLGSPRVVREDQQTALCFDGATDALVLPGNPIAGWAQFTIEALIKPDVTGPEEQRFLHIQDERDSRLLLETRLTPESEWALDTFLFVPPDTRLTLLDREKTHPTQRWQWVALTFDGTKMAHYVNGREELQGEVAFRPMTNGRMSIGVRLNKVSWYKGCIREIRFTPSALQEPSLQKEAAPEPDVAPPRTVRAYAHIARTSWRLPSRARGKRSTLEVHHEGKSRGGTSTQEANRQTIHEGGG